MILSQNPKVSMNKMSYGFLQLVEYWSCQNREDQSVVLVKTPTMSITMMYVLWLDSRTNYVFCWFRIYIYIYYIVASRNQNASKAPRVPTWRLGVLPAMYLRWDMEDSWRRRSGNYEGCPYDHDPQTRFIIYPSDPCMNIYNIFEKEHTNGE